MAKPNQQDTMDLTASTVVPDRHLDLGCGTSPRNPYRRGALCGTDIRPLNSCAMTEFKAANLFVDSIPWPDGYFQSVSAFDFIEHVPRVLPTRDGQGIRFPFVELMDEIWRVLAPEGRLFALTPCFPAAAAFQDPTHVNIITETTHAYFCGSEPLARMYGFGGRFEAVRAEWAIPELAQTAERLPWRLEWRRRRRARGRRLSYFLWELAAIKPQAQPGAMY